MMHIRQMSPEEIKIRYGTAFQFDQVFEIRCDEYEYRGEYEKIGDWCIENFQYNYVYVAQSSQIMLGGYGSRGEKSVKDLKTMWQDHYTSMLLNRMELRCSEDDAILFKLRWCHAEV